MQSLQRGLSNGVQKKQAFFTSALRWVTAFDSSWTTGRPHFAHTVRSNGLYQPHDGHSTGYLYSAFLWHLWHQGLHVLQFGIACPPRFNIQSFRPLSNLAYAPGAFGAAGAAGAPGAAGALPRP